MSVAPQGPAPSPERRAGLREWGGKCQSLDKKFAAKNESPANILQPGRIVNVLLYLAGIGSPV